MDDLPAITDWMETLATNERIKTNNPRTVWAKYKKTKAPTNEDGVPKTKRSYKAALAEKEAELDGVRQQAKDEIDVLKQQLKTGSRPDWTNTVPKHGQVDDGRFETDADNEADLAAEEEERSKLSHLHPMKD